MNIAAFKARHVEHDEAQARRYRAEARALRKSANVALGHGDREASDRWEAQARMCDHWAQQCEEAAEQFRGLNIEALA